ncbi:hypothetical protein [Motiliproteus sp. SC1-56]|uniref:hypothetical protein n=1 Tax=Motiliproteus sp. SC1-56 TaxID=2799565 RepID=UPI001A8C6FCD|nr:hypothetical protein [Motiliproteus sp. SC1-56]
MVYRRILTIIPTALLAAGLVLGLATQASDSAAPSASFEKVAQDTEALLETLAAYGAEKQAQALTESRKALEALDASIDALERQLDRNWGQMSQASRREARDALQALRRQRVRVAEYYGGLKNSSADTWEEVKQGFSGAYETLYRAWSEATHELAGPANR